ncbi:hypothetical protein EYF80_035980 [Liparis tanakae]|uniref:Uncharacterized protein n=1 Tax=Liparis tanakae TaxID=230148 RepID=A0A4Z2GKQ7_9TELE|nr:hypothetical protein EYF80_035980 [Liparis tanakae]
MPLSLEAGGGEGGLGWGQPGAKCQSLYIMSRDIYPAVRVQVQYSSSHSDKFLPRTDFSRGKEGSEETRAAWLRFVL